MPPDFEDYTSQIWTVSASALRTAHHGRYLNMPSLGSVLAPGDIELVLRHTLSLYLEASDMWNILSPTGQYQPKCAVICISMQLGLRLGRAQTKKSETYLSAYKDCSRIFEGFGDSKRLRSARDDYTSPWRIVSTLRFRRRGA